MYELKTYPAPIWHSYLYQQKNHYFKFKIITLMNKVDQAQINHKRKRSENKN